MRDNLIEIHKTSLFKSYKPHFYGKNKLGNTFEGILPEWVEIADKTLKGLVFPFYSWNIPLFRRWIKKNFLLENIK